jgi:uncharacterized protein YggE
MPEPASEVATTVTTVGEGAASGVPDTLRLHASVQHRSTSVSEALAGCASAVSAAGTAARAFTGADQVATRGLDVGQWHGDDGRPDGFYARHSLEIVCSRLDRAGELITALADTVGERLRIDHVELFVEDTARLRVSARAAAFADAREKAEELAALAGQRVERAVAVVEGAGAGQRPFEGAARAMAASGGTSFEPGTSSLSETLTVTWATGPL